MRLFVLLLLLIANAGYFAWTSGRLRDWGLAPAAQTEPQRLAQQIRPEALRILSTGTRADTTGPAEAVPADGANTPSTTPPQSPLPPIMTSRAITTTSGTTIRTAPTGTTATTATTTGAAAVAAAVLAATSAAAAASAPPSTTSAAARSNSPRSAAPQAPNQRP